MGVGETGVGEMAPIWAGYGVITYSILYTQVSNISAIWID